MFYGRIKNELGETLVELGPYIYVNNLVENLMERAPEWQPDYEMTVWMELP